MGEVSKSTGKTELWSEPSARGKDRQEKVDSLSGYQGRYAGKGRRGNLGEPLKHETGPIREKKPKRQGAKEESEESIVAKRYRTTKPVRSEGTRL